MQIFCLSDPHFGRDMSRFGAVWEDHEEKIKRRWRETIGPEDLVLVPGDVSWATSTKKAVSHMEAFDELPGQKVISPGNHDRWWKKTARMHMSTIRFLHNDHIPLGNGWTLAAAMGWEQPESPWWKEELMQEAFDEACRDLEKTLRVATTARPDTKILLMIHYPPRWKFEDTPTAFEEIIARYPVELLVYGHIHGVDLPMAHNRMMDVGSKQIRYENASVDRTDMTPIFIVELPGGPLCF